jgi:hypothetical protein
MHCALLRFQGGIHHMQGSTPDILPLKEFLQGLWQQPDDAGLETLRKAGRLSLLRCGAQQAVGHAGCLLGTHLV